MGTWPAGQASPQSVQITLGTDPHSRRRIALKRSGYVQELDDEIIPAAGNPASRPGLRGRFVSRPNHCGHNSGGVEGAVVNVSPGIEHAGNHKGSQERSTIPACRRPGEAAREGVCCPVRYSQFLAEAQDGVNCEMAERSADLLSEEGDEERRLPPPDEGSNFSRRGTPP